MPEIRPITFVSALVGIAISMKKSSQMQKTFFRTLQTMRSFNALQTQTHTISASINPDSLRSTRYSG